MIRVFAYMLYPVSWLFGIAMFFRNLFFDVHIFRSRRVSRPVISIGNVTTGGTGKTPAVVCVARLLVDKRYRVGIVSRGYKRRSRGFVEVSNGNGEIAPVERGGDEPVLLARLVPDAVVAVDENRTRGCMYIIERYNVDVIVIDDGFQHRKLHRDLDVVLLNGLQREHLKGYVPRGRLRESLYSMRRADIVVVTKCNDELEFRKMEKFVHQFAAKPVLRGSIVPHYFYDVFEKVTIPTEAVVSRKAFCVAGIANPDEFWRTLMEMGTDIADVRWFPDHHQFTERDIHDILRRSEQSGSEIIITTEKDSVRLESYGHLFHRRYPLYALHVEFEMEDGDRTVFERYVNQIMNNTKRSTTIR